jgi:hypothetical protein
MTERDVVENAAWMAKGLLIFRRPRPSLRQAAIRAAMELRHDVSQVPGVTVETVAGQVLQRLRASDEVRGLMARKQWGARK